MEHRVILIDENRGRAAILQQALVDAGYTVVGVIHSSENLLQRVQELTADVIIIDMESPNRDVLEHLSLVNRENPRPVVMFADNDDRETIQAAVKAGVSAYIVDGLSQSRVKSIMEVAIARFREYQAMRKELDETRNRLAERKLIEQAKGILMKRRNMDEESAYHALRKLAMDRNQRLSDVARTVISMADLLL